MYTNNRTLLRHITDGLMEEKYSVFLFLLVLVTAFLLVNTRHQTRHLIHRRAEVRFQKELIEVEWKNLLIEEKVLSDLERIKTIATQQLLMDNITADTEKELTVVLPCQ